MAPLQDTLIQPVQDRLHLGKLSKFLSSMNIAGKRREDQQRKPREGERWELIAFGISKASFDLFNQSACEQSLNIKSEMCFVWQKIVISPTES